MIDIDTDTDIDIDIYMCYNKTITHLKTSTIHNFLKIFMKLFQQQKSINQTTHPPPIGKKSQNKQNQYDKEN